METLVSLEAAVVRAVGRGPLLLAPAHAAPDALENFNKTKK